MPTTQSAAPVQIKVDAGRWLGELPHNWNYIGYDECNYTYAPEGQELLAKFGAMGEKPYYVRAHHLFCTGNCHGVYKWGSTNVYLEGDDGQPIYNWTFMDLILDTILKHRCKPFVELGFMPMHLVDPAHYDCTKDNGRFTAYQTMGWACPPKDYGRWHDLVYNLVRRCVDRYGEAEVATWYWELWNEPDIFYWRGTIEEFDKLYDTTAAAVKAACRRRASAGRARRTPTSNATPASIWISSWITASTARTASLARRAPRSISSPSTSRAAVTELIHCTRSKIHHPSNRSSGT